VRPDVLYHGTSLSGLVGIIHKNSITTTNIEEEPVGVSFTRDPRVAKKFTRRGMTVTKKIRQDLKQFDIAEICGQRPLEYGEYCLHHFNGGAGAIMVFDRTALSRKFGKKLQPIAMEGYGPGETAFGDEAEERILHATISDITSCLMSIHMINKTDYTDYETIVTSFNPIFAKDFRTIRTFMR
jgi:hypothetical protein